ncbi:helix-turn-helix transcriptional regulator [Agrobacterium sp. Ap1]|uniref:helix-turn-helix domain-containing protein n=1 Tax=Agrobacterium sp. Ap1 TaxID=2815337 RepID=UPI001A8F4683|nr:helix-turn-helix transcriptional regulator [Agrobacterium sp. Ap1]MBO0145172.1 helix-turn-helix transcriptional regulator [Agrobacterium sp. Ap1]
MARAALRWGVRDLAKNAGVTATTVSRIEAGKPAFSGTLKAIRAAFEAAGLQFIDQNGGGPGVRFLRPKLPKHAHLGSGNSRLDHTS